ncbi:MAG: hypothetical protein EHM49_04955, partial [Deltaproteobacteria bacterium]
MPRLLYKDNTMIVLELDNTFRSTFRGCRRKYFLTKHLNLATVHGSNALRYGSTWHAFIEGYYSHIKENGWAEDGKAIERAVSFGKAVWDHESSQSQAFDESDYRTFANCSESFLQYIAEFAYDKGHMEVVETEQVFNHIIELSKEEEALFPNLKTVEVHFTGRLDNQVRLSGMRWIVEHKSTGQPIKTQGERLNRSPQILGYSYAGKFALKFEAEGCLVSIHHISSRRTKSGEWGSINRDFKRIPQIFTTEDLMSWRFSYLSTCSDVVHHQEYGI